MRVKRRALIVSLTVLIVLLLAGAGMAWYYSSQVAAPLEAGSLALRRRDWNSALNHYRRVRQTLESSPALKYLLAADLDDAVIGEIQVHYHTGQDQEGIQLSNQRADASPEFARDPRRLLWTGNLWFRRAVEESVGKEHDLQRREQLNAALDFFRKALEANPSSWETKFNYELVSAVMAQENPVQQEKDEDQAKKRLLPRIRTDQQRQRRVLPPEDRG